MRDYSCLPLVQVYTCHAWCLLHAVTFLRQGEDFVAFKMLLTLHLCLHDFLHCTRGEEVKGVLLNRPIRVICCVSGASTEGSLLFFSKMNGSEK